MTPPNPNRRNAALQTHMVRRIVAAWHAASAEDLAAGLAWYDRAQDLAAALAAGADDVGTHTAAGVIAALSPRCGWGANVAGATAMVAAHAASDAAPIVAGTRSNRDKAWRVLQAGAHGDPLDVLGGPKVRAFYANIMGDVDQVTVDVWAARAAEGHDNDRAPEGARYERIERAYQLAADLVGVSPRDCQAAVWTYFRRTHARALYDVNNSNEELS